MPDRTTDREESLSDLFEVLSHQFRRYVLWALARAESDTEAALELDHLADGDEPDVLRLELVHNHLPKLDEYDYVDWDPATGTLGRGPRFEEIEPVLELLNENAETMPDEWP
jgi:hypothetical protein